MIMLLFFIIKVNGDISTLKIADFGLSNVIDENETLKAFCGR
jgi:hypothetical protein